ncbi:general transcription factor II-I repeat domain-containing protein 2-like [Stegodyphus dumicola]|uniref:general transcription factor II-I repeat domain-containing protein 2-like n=1 Tax=Stegodyphus dumicola TaxID=202533 RepID=UPI0015A86930|nr:general transcription factor II-I repeat domain-containing protein 2-like [Stegodyphus dumicola]
MTEVISSDVTSQLTSDFYRCSSFSLQLDESTDIVDTTQLTVFVRMVFDNFEVRENLMKIRPLTERITGQAIFLIVNDLINSENIPINKMVDLATDGSPAIVGRENGFIIIFHKDNSFPKVMSYHYVIYQEPLFGKFLSIKNLMKTVIKIANKVRAHAIQRHLFGVLTDELDCRYGDLVLHTEFR